jgi:nitrite reductase/ring-hydroxylating ferredoxin subunit
VTNYVVGTVDEIPPGGRKVVEIARRSIGVFNVKGRYYAIRNQCPHAGGPMCEGITSGLVRSERPGHYDYIMRGEIIRCPWHGWEFEIATGQSWFDPAKTKVAAYPTAVESGQELSEAGAELVAAGFQPGPYSSETYKVEIDRDYVIVNL